MTAALLCTALLVHLHQMRYASRELFHRVIATPESAHEYFSPIREQIQEYWFLEWFGGEGYEQKRVKVHVDLREDAVEILRKYSDYGRHSSSQKVESLRAQLGLNPQEKPHIVLLFVESLRGHEFFGPRVGPYVFPELTKLLGEHGTVFKNAYSSALVSGQTVRGFFSTLCSFLTNIVGPATLIYNPRISASCLQKVFSEGSGYQTAWFAPHEKEFHREVEFELSQSPSSIVRDAKYYASKGMSRFEGAIPDEVFIEKASEETLTLLADANQNEKNLFLRLVNFGTHHPWVSYSNAELAPEVISKLPQAPVGDYKKYLTTLNVADREYAGFVNKLFESYPKDNLLIVLLADHGIVFPAPFSSGSREQHIHHRFHIPIVFLTANNPNPKVLTQPVHQMDVAPTLAELVGIRPEKTWLGRSLFSNDHGSPWVYYDADEGLFFRDHEELCFQQQKGALRCVSQDKLEKSSFPYDEITFELKDPNNNKKVDLFLQSILAEHEMISNNTIRELEKRQ